MSKSKNRNRNKGKLVYFSEEEIEVINQNMQKLNMKNQSDYIREMSLKGKKILFNYDRNIHNVVTEINKIGTNINQIAKITNERRNIYHEDIKILQEELIKVRRIIDGEFTRMTIDVKKMQDESFMEIFEENFKL